MDTATITANVILAPGQNPTDVLAGALGTQHERHLITAAHVEVVTAHVATIVIRYDTAGGRAEVQDAANRLARTPCTAVDAIRVRYP